MASAVTSRNETKEDAEAIAEVTIAAFRTLEISNQTEQFVIEGSAPLGPSSARDWHG